MAGTVVADIRTLLRSPAFLAGLAIRLAIMLALTPYAISNWFVPFLSSSVEHLALDPWRTFLEAGGTALAFPYGYGMWLAFLPLAFVCHLVGVDLHWGYSLTLLVCDVALLLVLKSLLNTSFRFLTPLYWLSPIVLYATYWLGLNDLIPILLLCLALLQFRRLRVGQAGVLCAAAVSAKLSMVLAIPLIVIYIWHNRSLHKFLASFARGFAAVLVVLGVPFLLSPYAMRMLSGNPEMQKVYDFSMSIGAGQTIYLLPVAYLLATFAAWRMRRISFELFLALIGIVFLLVFLLTPASPGWLLWVLPFLIYYQIRNGAVAIGLVALLTLLYIALNFLGAPGPLHPLGGERAIAFAGFVARTIGERGVSLLHTGQLGLGIILIMTMYRYSVQTNDYFRISRRPIVVGIAGDSGAGKDTLVDSLKGLFGNHSVVTISGDDYHLWDRHKPMWQVMTHLNPRANDIAQFAEDLVLLKGDKIIQARHYDHGSGRKSKPARVKSNDFIIASGLHTLYTPMLRECYDLSIYLDIDEGLRRHFKLERDVGQRGHSSEKVLATLDQRESDSRRFIRPQSAHADLTLSLQPIHPRILEGSGAKHPLRLKLRVRARQTGHEEALLRVLIGVCGLHVDMQMEGDGTRVDITIEGETSSDDIAMAARYLMPQIEDLLDIAPKWDDGIKGLMQLVVLSHLNQALRKRLL